MVVALPGEGPAECYDGIDGVEVWDDTLVTPWLDCDQLGDTNKLLHLSGLYLSLTVSDRLGKIVYDVPSGL